MRQSESIDKLVAALIQFHSEVEPIAKNSTNPHFKSKYASLDAINDEVRPKLTKNGLAVVQGGEISERGIGVTTTLYHTSGQWISHTVEMPLEKATAQSAGSALTYGRRYGLSAILALSTEEDDDGNAASQRQKKKAIAEGKAATDEEVQKIVELAEVTGTMEVVRPHLKGITEEKARDMIARLTRKLKEMNS